MRSNVRTGTILRGIDLASAVVSEAVGLRSYPPSIIPTLSIFSNLPLPDLVRLWGIRLDVFPDERLCRDGNIAARRVRE